MGNVIAALDIGTQNATLLAGEYENGKLSQLHCVTEPSRGVKKGVIRDIRLVAETIQNLRKRMYDLHDVEIYDVVASFSAGEVQTVVRTGRKMLMPQHVIDENDMSEAEENAQASIDSAGTNIHLQSFRQKYEVSGQPVSTPIGMCGEELICNILEITAPRTALDALRSAVHRAGLRLQEIIYSGVAQAEAVLDRKSRESGTLIIDIGAGTCDYIALCNSVIVSAGTLAVGGAHLTNDLALAFKIMQNPAEDMKLARGSAMLQPEAAKDRYTVRTQFSTDDRTVSVHAIQTVTTERIDELFRILRSILSENQTLANIRGGIILTGGTAALPLIAEQAQAIFEMPCALGVPINVTQYPDDMAAAPFRYATAIGLLNYRARNLGEDDAPLTLLRRLTNFFRG